MIMNEIMKFEYEGCEISFLTGENTEINATQMAKRFSCQPIDWLKTDNAQRLITAYSVLKNISTADLVRVVQGGSPEKQGTWMHKDIALLFAHWLSPEFYFWCNDISFYLFRCGIVAAEEEARKGVVYSLTEFAKKIKNANTGNTRLGRTKVFQILRQEKILDKHNRPNKPYLERGWFELEPSKNCCYVKRTKVTEEGWPNLLPLFFPVQQQGDNSELIKLVIDLKDEILLIKDTFNKTESNQPNFNNQLLNKAIQNLNKYIQESKDLQTEMNELKLSVQNRVGREESLFKEVINRLHHLEQLEHGKIIDE